MTETRFVGGPRDGQVRVINRDRVIGPYFNVAYGVGDPGVEVEVFVGTYLLAGRDLAVWAGPTDRRTDPRQIAASFAVDTEGPMHNHDRAHQITNALYQALTIVLDSGGDHRTLEISLDLAANPVAVVCVSAYQPAPHKRHTERDK